ncbi:tyrosine-type recombinase/integrase [Glycomyces salinus]|uniref:tyrosine-type recombinase/integrase n=1 Tax=Glycomyces salinus TaxID=980294 RepID=UPI0018EC0E23|nr:tyrosine-type recombinase/integrase [Glycomyces salinus]
MATTPPQGRKRGRVWQHGNRLQIRVSAGTDIVTGKRLYLNDAVPFPPGATAKQQREAWKAAENRRAELVAQVDQGRAAKTDTEFRSAVDEWLRNHRAEVEASTHEKYAQLARDYVKPALGGVKLTQIQGLVKSAEDLLADLAVCWRRCGGRIKTDHHQEGRGKARVLAENELEDHRCTKRCGPHECKPASLTIRLHLHTIVKGSLDAAHRWGWIAVNPAGQIRRPKRKATKPEAPSPDQAAALINAAFEEDFEWGVNIWVLFMTSSRRSEHCATQLRHVDFRRKKILVNPLKTDTDAWMSLDATTLGLLGELRDRIAEKKAALGLTLTGEEYLYSYSPGHSKPGSLSHFTRRFGKMAGRLGFHATPHKARHYTAAELMASGIDPVTIAYRLNHANPKTTLDFYAAWRPRGDEHAVAVIADQMPAAPSDRNERPDRDHSAEQPRRTSPELEARICDLSRRTGWGPKRIAEHLTAENVEIAQSTVWLVLKRHGLNRGDN